MIENKISESNRKISIITYGCTFNRADSQKMEEILINSGYKITSLNESDIVIINTCAVKQNTELKILSFIEKLSKNSNKKIVVGGCLPQIDINIFNQIKELIKNHGGIILHPGNVSKISNYLQGKDIYEFHPILSPKERDKSKLVPVVRDNHAIIQISEGCNNKCSYCCTTIARGDLISFEFERIISQINSFVNKGIKEFFLTSQDLGNYNYGGKDLLDLLLEISKIKGDFKIRLGMINPDYFNLRNIDEFLQIFNDRRFYRFLHIPIQSASDRILKLMNRHYIIDDVNLILKHIKSFDKEFTIATDIIVGFPGETHEDFLLTIDWIKKWKPLVVNISKYSDRPNTIAKKMRKVDSKIVKSRSVQLSKIYGEYVAQKLKKIIGKQLRVFFNEYYSNKKYPFMGRTDYYIPVISEKGILWAEKIVKIMDIQSHSLVGKVID